MKILADLHTHTIASGHAYSTLSENAAAAARKGLILLGMTDHGPSMPGTSDLYYFGNFTIIPQTLSGVRILPGVEANITSHEGELDIPLRYLKQMSIVLVGLHVICYPGGNSEQNTQAYLKAMSNPFVDIMVHPGRPEFEMDLEKVAYTSAQLGIPVELNNSSLSQEKGGAWSNCHYFACNAAKYGGPIVLGSDAHFWDRVGVFDFALELANGAGIKEEQILNYSPNRILNYLEQRRKQRSSIHSF